MDSARDRTAVSVVAGTITRMTDREQIQIPPRYARVNAWVISRDTDAEVQFLTSVFDALETPGSRMLDAEGDIAHVEAEVGQPLCRPGRPGGHGLRPAHPAGGTGGRQLGNHPTEYGGVLQHHDDAHERQQGDAPSDHFAEDLAFLPGHPDRTGRDRQVLRADHLAQHSTG